MLRRIFFCAPILAALVACGGGGGGSPVPSTPVATPSTAPASATVQFTVGQSQAIQGTRRPQYISPHTLSLVVAYNGAKYPVNFIQGTPACTGAIPNLVCTVQFTAATGSDAFTVAAYDQYNGNGNLLSQAQITASISAGVNKVSAVLDGVPVSASVQKAINVPEAIATSVPFAVTAYDSDGAAIVGPGNYATPIPLSDSDTGGGTSVSASVTSPGTSPTLTYNGTSPVSYGASVGANVGFGNARSGLVRLVPQYTQYNTPSGRMAYALAAAADGSLWVIEAGSAVPTTPMEIAHVAADGTATEFPLSTSLGQSVMSMVVGPDGAVWCMIGQMNGATSNAIVRIDASGNATSYTNGQMTIAGKIVVGPDKRLWFTQRGAIGAMDTATHYITFYSDSNNVSGFNDLTVGPDGNLWAADGMNSAIVRITPSGTMTSFAMPSSGVVAQQPNGIAAQGSSLYVTTDNTIYQFDTSGNVLKTYSLPNFTNGGITAASNGSVWVPLGDDIAGGSMIARLSSGGVLSIVSVPFANDPGIGAPSISHMAGAADGSMWYVRDVAYGKIVVH